MTRKHYTLLAGIVGDTLAAASLAGGEDTRTAVYWALYAPLVTALQADNPRFDHARFAYTVGVAEAAKLAEGRR